MILLTPKVSVVTITYGHEEYIRDTLDGVLMQQYNGAIEFIIADDNSPDKTEEVVTNYFKEHPLPNNFEFKYTRHETNIGVMPNFIWAVQQASGKYIALCEGDDYWTDPYKLQKQVQVLEKNPQIKICTHPSVRLYGDDLKKDEYGYWGDNSKIISAKQVIRNYASTAGFQSIVVRNENISELSRIVENLLGSHSTIQMFYAMPNGLFYLPDYMAVYRKNSTNSISKELFKKDEFYLNKQKKNWKGLEYLNYYSNFYFDDQFKLSLRYRVLDAIGSTYLNSSQIWDLITEYKLYKNPYRLVRVLLLNLNAKIKNWMSY